MAISLTKKKPPKIISLDLKFPIRLEIITFQFEREIWIELSEGLMKRSDEKSKIRRIRVFSLNFSGFPDSTYPLVPSPGEKVQPGPTKSDKIGTLESPMVQFWQIKTEEKKN